MLLARWLGDQRDQKDNQSDDEVSPGDFERVWGYSTPYQSDWEFMVYESPN
ncbi:MAG: hypothetical protein AAGK93_06365 [Pseudomonadota bacterium]